MCRGFFVVAFDVLTVDDMAVGANQVGAIGVLVWHGFTLTVAGESAIGLSVADGCLWRDGRRWRNVLQHDNSRPSGTGLPSHTNLVDHASGALGIFEYDVKLAK